MEIVNPKRILAIGASDAGLSHLLKELTGTAPQPVDDSLAGLTHPWNLKTSYYTADLSVWTDELRDLPSWRTDFSKDEAREVVSAVGAWIYVFKKPVTEEDLEKIRDTVSAIREIVVKALGEYADITILAVGTRQNITTSRRLEGDEWEDFCAEQMVEYVDAEAKGMNEYGEKLGVARLREALEATDWQGDSVEDVDDFGGVDDFEHVDDVGFEDVNRNEAELYVELLGMKNALHEATDTGVSDSGGDEEKIDELNRMMGTLITIKDTASSMPEAERRKFAAKAVKDLMKDV